MDEKCPSALIFRKSSPVGDLTISSQLLFLRQLLQEKLDKSLLRTDELGTPIVQFSSPSS